MGFENNYPKPFLEFVDQIIELVTEKYAFEAKILKTYDWLIVFNSINGYDFHVAFEVSIIFNWFNQTQNFNNFDFQKNQFIATKIFGYIERAWRDLILAKNK